MHPNYPKTDPNLQIHPNYPNNFMRELLQAIAYYKLANTILEKRKPERESAVINLLRENLAGDMDFRLDTDLEEKLKEQIKKYNGEIVIVMHPFFKMRSTDHEVFFKKLMRYCSNIKNPLFIFEGKNRKGETEKQFKNAKTEVIYKIPTLAGKPTPDCRCETKKAWDKFIFFLNRMGVKKVIINGQLFETDKINLEELTKTPKGAAEIFFCGDRILYELNKRGIKAVPGKIIYYNF